MRWHERMAPRANGSRSTRTSTTSENHDFVVGIQRRRTASSVGAVATGWAPHRSMAARRRARL